MLKRTKLSAIGIIAACFIAILLTIVSSSLIFKLRSPTIKILPAEIRSKRVPTRVFFNISTFAVDSWEAGHRDVDLQYIASHYDLLITDGYSYYNSKVSHLRELNPNLKILAYRNGTIIVKGSSDWSYITANHPGWFLLDSQGNRIFEKDYPLNYLLDPQNSGWKAYRAEQLEEYVGTYGYDGIYLDVIHPWILSGDYLYYNAHPINPRTVKPFTNSEWWQANLDFL